MTFLNPLAFGLFIIVPVMMAFLVYRGRVRRRMIERIGDAQLVALLLSQVRPWRRRLKATLWIATLTLTLTALARPSWGLVPERIIQDGTQVLFVVDVSRSMDAEDIPPSRLQQVKLDLLQFAQLLPDNDYGIVVFARTARTRLPLTNDLVAFELFVNGISTSNISAQGTNLEAALLQAIDSFETRVLADRVIVLLSDGEALQGTYERILADEPLLNEITIYTIGYGTRNGAIVPEYSPEGDLLGYKELADGTLVISRLNPTTLQDIAAQAGGQYIQAISSGEHIEALTEIIRTQHMAENESITLRPADRFYWFIGIALVLLSLDMLLRETV